MRYLTNTRLFVIIISYLVLNVMTEKQSSPELNSDKSSEKGKSYYTALFGGTLFTGIVIAEGVIGVRYSLDMPDPTIDKVVEAVIRHNAYRFYAVTEKDYCPPPSDPADTSVLFNAIVHQTKTPESIAEQYNLELPDFKVLADMLPAMRNASTSQEITDLVNTYTQAQMNVTVHADQIHEDDSIELDAYKGRAWEFMMIMKNIPKPVFDKIGIEDILITTAENSSPTSLAEYRPAIKQVNVDFDYLDSPKVLIHEILGHGIHDEICTSTDANDKAFAALNPPGHVYIGDEWKTTHYNADNHASSYATSNVGEDYAETTEEYLSGTIRPNLIGVQYPVEKKVSLILDRLDKFVPGSAEYFSSRIEDFAASERFHEHRVKREEAKK